MRIKELYIKNFRSIEELNIELQPLCAFIGPNNAGKSNILDALDLVLGETYPTIRAFSARDFRNHDTSQAIEIRTTFDGPIDDGYGNSNIYGMTLKVKNLNDIEYFPIDEDGNRVRYRSGVGGQMRVSNLMRQQIPLLHISIDRRVESQLRPTSWTLWGKIQKELNRIFEENGQRVGDFRMRVDEATKLLYISELHEVEKILRENIRANTNLPDLSLKFGLVDPIQHYKNLRPYLKNIDGGSDFDPEEMGLGTQSTLIVALAEAYRQLVRESVVMLVDEPELYLHPHACRHFYSVLKALSQSGVQVVYTTHSPTFLDVADHRSIYLVHKENDKTNVSEGSKAEVSSEDRLKMMTRFDTTMSEVLFAKVVLLVEGAEDRIACSRAFQLDKLKLDKEGISVTCCGGKPGIPFVAKILTGLKISTCVFCDRDPGKPTEKISDEIRGIVGHDNFFELPSKLEDALELDGDLSQIELMELLDKYSSVSEMPETFSSTISQVMGRVKRILGFDKEEENPFPKSKVEPEDLPF